MWGVGYAPSKSELKKTDPENLRRLAKYLGLNVDGYSHRHVASLIRWRITRRNR